MAISRQFKALGKITGFVAAAWGMVGALVGALGAVVAGSGAVLASIYTLGVIYGCVGGVAGAVTALLIGRAEYGRRIDELHPRRMAAWSLLGGIGPAVVFGSTGAIFFGASASEVLGLLGAGLVTGGVGGAMSASISAAAKRTALSEQETHPELPAT
ncbi:MAG: hypothetical protein ACYSTY_03755 [Planctomycetota bacterium]|jgi:hypothetical protein